MDEKKSFGEYIRKKRQEAGLTQRGLAELLFVTESTVSKWERGAELSRCIPHPGGLPGAVHHRA